MQSASLGKRMAPGAAALAACLLCAGIAAAQPAPDAFGPARTPRESAPIDLTGQWVSIVTEDWRFRMLTPPRGEYPGVELMPAGRAAADAWDPARDEAEGNACKAYGAGGIMRVPGRIRISWEDDTTLRLETDAGSQVRLFHFDPPPEGGEPTWQGVSRAEWIVHAGAFGTPPGDESPNGSLVVVTTNAKPGYLRKNGVPYGERAVITEYFDVLRHPDGTEWLVVKTIVEDPQYLASPYIVSSNFRKEEGRAGWSPTGCSAG